MQKIIVSAISSLFGLVLLFSLMHFISAKSISTTSTGTITDMEGTQATIDIKEPTNDIIQTLDISNMRGESIARVGDKVSVEVDSPGLLTKAQDLISGNNNDVTFTPKNLQVNIFVAIWRRLFN